MTAIPLRKWYNNSDKTVIIIKQQNVKLWNSAFDRTTLMSKARRVYPTRSRTELKHAVLREGDSACATFVKGSFTWWVLHTVRNKHLSNLYINASPIASFTFLLPLWKCKNCKCSDLTEVFSAVFFVINNWTICVNMYREERKPWHISLISWREGLAELHLHLRVHICLSTCGEMISFDLFENFNLNRVLLLAIGLWPYQRSKFVRCQLILITVILTSFIAFQVRHRC